MIANQDASLARDLSQVRARARLRKTIRLRRAHYMHKRPLDLSGGRRSNRVALVAGACVILLVAFTLGTPITAALAAVGVYAHYAKDLPPAETLGQLKLGQSTKIYDRNGGLLYEMYDPSGGRRTLIIPEQVTPLVKAAFVATEDATFDTNPGVEPQAIARALWHLAIYHEITSGGSTITQQLV
jgi:membrane peptidoglycan carboxypeptidase